MKFLSVILIICLFRAYISQPVSSSNSTSENDSNTTPRTVQEKHPSHVVIRVKDRGFLLCEGVLIGLHYVLTTARCMHRYSSTPKSLEAVAGLSSTNNIDSNENAQRRQVSEVKLHPDWLSSKKQKGDLAILKLLNPLKKTENVDISPYGKNVKVNDTVQVVGYGKNDEITSRIFKVSNSSSTYGNKIFVGKENNDTFEDNFSDPSYSGAPIFPADANNEVCGIVSSSPYGSNTYLTYYAEWIEINTNITRIKNEPSSTTTQSTSSLATITQAYETTTSAAATSSTSPTTSSATTQENSSPNPTSTPASTSSASSTEPSNTTTRENSTQTSASTSTASPTPTDRTTESATTSSAPPEPSTVTPHDSLSDETDDASLDEDDD